MSEPINDPKDAAARALVEGHYEVDSHLTTAYRMLADDETEGRDDEPLKVLEVDEMSFPSPRMWPLGFRPAPEIGVPFEHYVLVVTPEEFDDIRSGSRVLPRGWRLGREYPRAAEAVPAGAAG